MNLPLLIILITLNNPFFKRIASDFSAHSNYLILCIEKSDQKIIIENDDLYTYMNRRKRISKKKYVDKICNIYESNKCLTYKELGGEKPGIHMIRYIDQVAKKKNLGREKFVEFYFDNRVFKTGFSEEEKFAVIAQLFEWEMSCYQDDETGYLILNN